MHTFYVDNIFVYEPLPHVRKMYYLDVNFYRYFIGRSDQSVNEQVMIGRIDQQIRVTKLMMGYYDVTKLQNKKLRRYMTRYLEIMMVVSSILAIRSGTDENMAKKKELWEYVKKTNPRLYIRLRFGFLGQGMNLPGKGGRQISIAGYKIAQKFFDLTDPRPAGREGKKGLGAVFNCGPAFLDLYKNRDRKWKHSRRPEARFCPRRQGRRWRRSWRACGLYGRRWTRRGEDGHRR